MNYEIHDEGKIIYFIGKDGFIFYTIKHKEFEVYTILNSCGNFVCNVKAKNVAIKYVENTIKDNKIRVEKSDKEFQDWVKSINKSHNIFMFTLAALTLLVVISFVFMCAK
jgi:hypothetical protein